MNTNKLAKFHTQVVPSDLVYLDAALFDFIGAQANEYRVAFLSTALDLFSVRTKSYREPLTKPKLNLRLKMIATSS